MQKNVHSVMSEELNMKKLFCLAEVRFGLTVVSQVLHNLLVEKSLECSPDIITLLQAAKLLCEKCGCGHAK